MNRIHIKRNMSFFGMARKMKVFIDGKHVADVKNEKTTTVEFQNGEHEIQVGMDWCKSNKIRIKESEEEFLSIDTVIFPLAMLFSLFYPPGVFKLKKDESNQSAHTTPASAPR